LNIFLKYYLEVLTDGVDAVGVTAGDDGAASFCEGGAEHGLLVAYSGPEPLVRKTRSPEAVRPVLGQAAERGKSTSVSAPLLGDNKQINRQISV